MKLTLQISSLGDSERIFRIDFMVESFRLSQAQILIKEIRSGMSNTCFKESMKISDCFDSVINRILLSLFLVIMLWMNTIIVSKSLIAII